MTEFWTLFFTFGWVPFIIVLSLLVGGFIEWLKFKTKQRELGASTEETEEKLRALQAAFDEQQKALTRRIEHLEAIVTSEEWDLLEAGTEGHRALDVPGGGDLAHERRAARLARRTNAQ